MIQAIGHGDVLCHFAELLSGRLLGTWEKKPKNDELKLKNVQMVVNLLLSHHSSAVVAAESIVAESESDQLQLLYHMYQTFVLKAPQVLCLFSYPSSSSPQKRYDRLRKDLVHWLNKQGIAVNNLAAGSVSRPFQQPSHSC